MYGWGYNLSGQVGNNGSASVNAPVQISTATNWAMVSAGAAHSMAVTREGQLWGWGSNAESQLGNGGPDISAPAQIGTASNWISVTAGNAHTFGLRSDNTLWGWGRNVEGQLGKGDNTQAPVPVSIP
jgi:alpha-tubulin suppressor-like RCC1 family protein